jgi:hypothetical protein
MSNFGEYYDHTTYPNPGAQGSSAAMRSELSTIEQAFNKLPALSGNANKLAKINASGTAMETSNVLSEDGTDATVSGDLYITGTQIGRSASRKITLPDVDGDTFALLTATQTLSNKTLVAPNLGTPSVLIGTNITGTAANLTAGSVATNANLTGEVTSVGNVTTITNASVIGKLLTGFSAASGVVAATDTIIQAFNKIVGNITSLTSSLAGKADVSALDSKANLASPNFSGTPQKSGVNLATTADITNERTAVASLSNKTLANYTESVFAISDTAGVALDPNNGPIQTWTLGDNRTPTQANWASGQSITLQVDDGTERTIDWSTLGVLWKTNNGTAPTLQTSGFTVLVLWKVGSEIYGARVGDA